MLGKVLHNTPRVSVQSQNYAWIKFSNRGSHKRRLLFKMQMRGPRAAANASAFNKRSGYENKHSCREKQVEPSKVCFHFPESDPPIMIKPSDDFFAWQVTI